MLGEVVCGVFPDPVDCIRMGLDPRHFLLQNIKSPTASAGPIVLHPRIFSYKPSVYSFVLFKLVSQWSSGTHPVFTISDSMEEGFGSSASD